MGVFLIPVNSNIVEATLSAESWIGENFPYEQAVSIIEIKETTYAVEIAPSENASLVEKIAYINASFCGGKITPGNLTVQALGKKPEVDIPIVVIVRGEI